MPTTLSEKAKKVKSSSTLAITAKAKALRAQGEDVVSFGAGEPDFPTPENIRAAAHKAIDAGMTRYTPASGTVELKEAICKKFKEFNGLDYQTNQIVVSNGGKHSLTNVFEAILNPGDEVIIPAPFWLSYPEIVRLAGGEPVILTCGKEIGYKMTAEALKGKITPKTKALVLNTPNNPTGAIYTKDELKAIGDLAVAYDFYIVSDEMYENLFYAEGKHVSIGSLSPEIYEKTITVSGVSKSYAMTGWRIGYTGSSKEIASLMGSIQSHQTSNPCSISQAAAVEALNGGQETVAEMNAAFNERRQYIHGRVNSLPMISAVEPQGAFYLFVDCSEVLGKKYKGKEIKDAADIAAILIEDYKVAVVPCADFGFADHLRLSYAISKEEIAKGLDRMEEFLKTL
ncbi:pyridoxal phosphate-dependent aminotransferase [Cuneatibacter sp. NSJ-177]|uniref:pyridoxal phosphate-dependent aminotransferase n=1 Tax=Cuneatibacter sp. NSJ-177 TaxID=2931401 RepID=UPI001FD1C129|nr:pyridoxal phosphate-dependent aminotransferase [Cuneatibacter sp. NSJ-177]MCJ7835913.1 pyridoxal phosphate-dependent aminotransferase [Cuneatibacter sp. NSJ-177]